MHSNIITATEAMRTFSDLLNQVRYQGRTFEIKRGKEIIAKITPALPAGKGLQVSALNDFFEHLPSLDKKDSADFQKTVEEVRAMKLENDAWD